MFQQRLPLQKKKKKIQAHNPANEHELAHTPTIWQQIKRMYTFIQPLERGTLFLSSNGLPRSFSAINLKAAASEYLSDYFKRPLAYISLRLALTACGPPLLSKLP